MSEIVEHSTKFSEFLDESEKYSKLLSAMAVNGKRTLIIDFSDLYSYDTEYATAVLEAPRVFEEALPSQVKMKLQMRTADPTDFNDVRVAFRGLPSEIPLREIGSRHIGKLIQAGGITVKATSIQPFCVLAAWRCVYCGELTAIPQKGDKLIRAAQCGACEKKKFVFEPAESIFIDSQWITLQELPEELPPGRLPRNLRIQLKGPLVDVVRPGDRASVNGVMRLADPKRGSRMFNFMLAAHHVEVAAQVDLEITPEDEEAILELSRDPKIFEKIISSLATSIHGYRDIKEAICYLLFGGQKKERQDVTIRGDINVFLIGDPGTAKSQLLRYTSNISPRGILTSGKGSSGAGLTASVQKESGSGNFVLEAGALVLGDMGVVCIDEFDKMDEDDRDAIHMPMEQQIVPIAKGGIVATLNARTSILAAANPAFGRFNPYQTIAGNMNLPVTILSRFDLIFIIRDTPDTERDKVLAHHILNIHQETKETPSEIEQDLLRKYIAYAKKNVHPKLSKEASECLEDFYGDMRRASIEGGEQSAISITPRQLESAIRLAEARARMHLREKVSAEDAMAARSLLMKSLEMVGIDVNTGEIDIDILYTGRPRSMQFSLSKVLGTLRSIETLSGAVKDDDLYKELVNQQGIGLAEASRLVGILMRDGTIYSPRPGYYKVTS